MKQKISYICPKGHALKKEPTIYYYNNKIYWICSKCGKKEHYTAWEVEKWQIVGKI